MEYKTYNDSNSLLDDDVHAFKLIYIAMCYKVKDLIW